MSKLVELATKYFTSPYCIALAWLLQQGDHVLPIPGASKPTSILDSARAVQVHLTREELRQLS